MNMRWLGTGAAIVVAAAIGAACGGGGSGGAGGATSSSSSASSSGTAGASSSSGSATSSTSSGASTSSSTSSSSTTAASSSGVVHGACAKPCAAPADCCPPNMPGCPNSQFPNNYLCTDGACREPQCSTKADCTALNPKLDCFTIGGFNTCAFACAADADCNAPLTCIGKDDNSKSYCLAMGSGCTDDASCLGLGKCVDKVCVCDADADCVKAGFTKCAK